MSFCVRMFVSSMSISVDRISDWIGKGCTTMSIHNRNITSATCVRFVWLHTRAIAFHIVACACASSCRGSQSCCCHDFFFEIYGTRFNQILIASSISVEGLHYNFPTFGK